LSSAFERLAERDDQSQMGSADGDQTGTRFVPPPPVPVHEVMPTPAIDPVEAAAEHVVAPAPEPIPIGPEPESTDAFDVVVDDEIAITVGPELSPNIPRMCRTCRDFRPADSGERGWCTNRWAFTHRRMVDDDELPCETSLGCWWLPHDETWLAAADISSHGQATPLVDRWLGDRAPVPRRQPS
jgi:hypothetical protein